MSQPGPDFAHILVVDDDARLRDLLRRYLSDNGFIVSGAADTTEARTQLAGLQFDLLIVDVMMPGETGLDLVRSLREAGQAVPVLMLTARGEIDDRIAGLEHGADDYLAKPFEPRELVLRVNAILRRSPRPPAPEAPSGEISLGRFTYDLERQELREGDERVHLTTAETGLLATLAEQPGEMLSRDDLASAVELEGNLRSVDVLVTRLRRKVEDDPRQPRYLQTVRGKGYILRPD